MHTVRFGVMGAGHIAGAFCQALTKAQGTALEAVGSRSPDKARAFAQAHGAKKAYGSYEQLLADGDVDIVYVATITPEHHRCVTMALEAGKHVLVEKPFAVNAHQARQMIDLARARGLLLMEAMWTRYLPTTQQAIRWVREGAIGTPKMMNIDLRIDIPWGEMPRLERYELCGSTVLDCGCYLLAEAFALMGRPEAGCVLPTLMPNGVDEQAGILLRHPGGGITAMTVGLHVEGSSDAEVLGTEGRLLLPKFQGCEKVTLIRKDGEERAFARPLLSPFGFEFEAMEAARCLREGLTESPLLPLEESLAIMQQLDTLRASYGLRYQVEGER